jgi:hypothetical protein
MLRTAAMPNRQFELLPARISNFTCPASISPKNGIAGLQTALLRLKLLIATEKVRMTKMAAITVAALRKFQTRARLRITGTKPICCEEAQ